MRRKGCKLQEGICLDKEKQRKSEVQTNTISKIIVSKDQFPISKSSYLYICINILDGCTKVA